MFQVNQLAGFNAVRRDSSAGPTSPYDTLYITIEHDGTTVTRCAELQLIKRSDGMPFSIGSNTAIGSMTSGGGVAAGFDGTTAQAGSASAQGAGTSGNTLGIYFNVDGAQDIEKLVFWEPSDGKIDGGSNTETVNIVLFGTNGGTPSGGDMLQSWNDIHNGIGDSVYSTEVELNIDTGAITVLSP